MAMPDSDHKQALPPGHQLGRYRLLGVLGVGGFGVTYLGEHISLGHRVAVKEYLPNEFAVREGATVHPKSSADREDFEWGLTRFVDEARTLTRFRHPNLVRVSDYFEANNTAYIVMDYEDGEPLDVLLERHGTLTEAQLKRVLLPVVDGLRQVHAAGFLHRDIKPSNLFVRRSDETPVLLDFGTARQALGRKSKSMTAIASAGYSPPEQYESQGAQGAWTDIYALSALCYRAITGKAPMEALRRQSQLLRSQVDPLPKLAETAVPAYSQAFLEAVDGGLRVIETERPQSLDEWLVRMELVEAPDPPKVPKTSARSKREKTVGPKPPKPTGRDARRRTGTSTSPETSARPAARRREALAGIISVTPSARPAARRREGFGARAVWLGSAAAAAIGVTLYFALDHWPQGSGQGTTVESAPRRSDGNLVGGGSALLVVETQPAGVEVLIGDESVGETPLELANLRAGARDLTLRHPHYETIRLEDQEFADGKVLRVERTLTRGVGELTVLTTPRNAWVERDGERLASRTPVTLEDLPAGPLELTLGADGHRTARVQAEVPKDGLGRLERTLEPIVYGTLTLELIPADAAVTLPDIESPYRPGMRLPEGRYRVEVSAEGYVSKTETVQHGASGATIHRVELELEVGRRFRDCAECPEMVVVPSGSFMMGSPSHEELRYDDEGPVHQVRIGRPLAVGVYEVTFAEWDACVAAGGCGGYRPDDADWGRGRRPVMNVSWEDAQSYVEWLSGRTGHRYRLLSESEWEYAARAGTTGPFHTGSTISTDQANYNGTVVYGPGREGVYRRQILPVGSFPANGFGLHDVHGNVYEWVQDCWNASYRGAPSDGSAWESGDCSSLVLRGGSWGDEPGYLRSAVRNGGNSGFRSSFLGFRVARERTELSLLPQPFTVAATPSNANVEVLGVAEAYRAEMPLAPGEYRVEVSAEGYASKTETVQHGTSGATVHRVELEKLFAVGEPFRDCPDCPELVVVPSGNFMMGSPSHEELRDDDEGPVHQVRIGQPFAVGVYEVTFAEWDACVAAGGCGGYRPDDADWGRGRRPVMNVNWADAQSYVEWLSGRIGHRYRLLSESEWEYVARAGTTTPFHTGSTISADQANYDGRISYPDGADNPNGVYHGQTLPVGSFPANGFGLHDVHGNVYEWVQDCWNASYRGAPSDESAWESGNCSRRVLRGGSWGDEPGYLRSAVRNGGSTGGRAFNVGFRVARERTELLLLPQPFTVAATPSDAGVEILGVAEAYRAGMPLAPGEYRVEVSAEGYVSKTETVQHGTSGATVHRVELEKLFAVGEPFRDCPDCPELVVVPSGSFMMGSPSHEELRVDEEGPVHQVRIGQPFAVGVYEVTVSEFGHFVDETGHSAGDSCYTSEGDEWESREDRGWRNPGFGQGSAHPVVCMSWHDARAYVDWLSRRTGEHYRLLSESEWEYVARAGTRTARYWGEGESGQCGHANGVDTSAKRQYSFLYAVSCDDGHVHAAPVGSYGTNAWGLHDVLGNVLEWTADCWNDSYTGALSDGSAWESGDCSSRVLRGGSWGDEPRVLRSAFRYGGNSGTRYNGIGFRVARTLTP